MRSIYPPLRPPENASSEVLGETLADLLEWAVKARLGDLLEAGLSHADVFRLRKVADDYRKGPVTEETYAASQELLPKLGGVVIF